LNVRVPKKLIPIFSSKHRFIVLYGGRDSAKSHTIARHLILTAYGKTVKILCTREIQKSIRDSSYALLVSIISKYKLNSYFEITRDEIRCTTTGSVFIFKGLKHNTEDIKGTEGVDICWVEEARNVSYDSWRILIPTIRKEGSQIIISFNPDDLSDPVYDMFITHKRPDAMVIKINYNENPFLSETSRKEIEYMMQNDPDTFSWIYGGDVRATSEKRILHNVIIHDFEIQKDRKHNYGADWGFSDPNTIVQNYIYDNELYICREYFRGGLNPEELKNRYMDIDWIQNKRIIADSARPEIINLMNSTKKFVFVPASKNVGQPQKEGAFKFTMAMYFKSFRKIHIHATNCPNAAIEFPKWSWEMDKNEKILDIVEDGDDHTVDATIYSLEAEATKWYSSQKPQYKRLNVSIG
jgi:phage terminase large subunit